MHYKTITLELLQDRPEIYDQLLLNRNLRSSLDSYAIELRESHLDWKENLLQRKPESDPNQIASEALELAIEELVRRLPSELLSQAREPLSLDGAIAYICNHTQTA
ncbi:hypothetical protein BH10PLA2_BH10PLA2_30720 [soil metagenome]